MDTAEIMENLHGQRTAENYIDECVLRRSEEPEILYRILLKLQHRDAALYAFAEYLHKWMESEHAN